MTCDNAKNQSPPGRPRLNNIFIRKHSKFNHEVDYVLVQFGYSMGVQHERMSSQTDDHIQ